MRVHSTLIVLFALVLFTTAAYADSLVYIVNGSQQFGTLNLATGAFQQIGPTLPEAGSFGLATAPNGSLVTFAYSSNLYSINPATGSPTLVGPTGLADCATPTSPCGPTSSATLGNFAGKIYATDFQNNLYDVNSVTGAATLIGATGIPALPFVPGTQNLDGTVNLFDESFFAAGAKLYMTYDAFTFDFGSLTIVTIPIAPKLYQVDPSTGHATIVGPTDVGIGAVADVNGTYYAFNDITQQVSSLDLASGSTSSPRDFDPAAGVVQGAFAVTTPEPDSVVMIGIAIFDPSNVVARSASA